MRHGSCRAVTTLLLLLLCVAVTCAAARKPRSSSGPTSPPAAGGGRQGEQSPPSQKGRKQGARGKRAPAAGSGSPKKAGEGRGATPSATREGETLTEIKTVRKRATHKGASAKKGGKVPPRGGAADTATAGPSGGVADPPTEVKTVRKRAAKGGSVPPKGGSTGTAPANPPAEGTPDPPTEIKTVRGRAKEGGKGGSVPPRGGATTTTTTTPATPDPPTKGGSVPPAEGAADTASTTTATATAPHPPLYCLHFVEFVVSGARAPLLWVAGSALALSGAGAEPAAPSAPLPTLPQPPAPALLRLLLSADTPRDLARFAAAWGHRVLGTATSTTRHPHHPLTPEAQDAAERCLYTDRALVALALLAALSCIRSVLLHADAEARHARALLRPTPLGGLPGAEDIDTAPSPPAGGGAYARLFGGTSPPPPVVCVETPSTVTLRSALKGSRQAWIALHGEDAADIINFDAPRLPCGKGVPGRHSPGDTALPEVGLGSSLDVLREAKELRAEREAEQNRIDEVQGQVDGVKKEFFAVRREMAASQAEAERLREERGVFEQEARGYVATLNEEHLIRRSVAADLAKRQKRLEETRGKAQQAVSHLASKREACRAQQEAAAALLARAAEFRQEARDAEALEAEQAEGVLRLEDRRQALLSESVDLSLKARLLRDEKVKVAAAVGGLKARRGAPGCRRQAGRAAVEEGVGEEVPSG